MTELPDYWALLRQHDVILHKPLLLNSYLAFKIRTFSGPDSVLFKLRFDQCGADFSGKMRYVESPVSLSARRSQSGNGKYSFRFESRPEMQVDCVCQVNPMVHPPSSTTTSTVFRLSNLNTRFSLTDYPYEAKGEFVYGKAERWLGGAFNYSIHENRVLEMDFALGLGEIILRRYSGRAQGIYELALLRQVNSRLKLAALVQSNGSDFHFFEVGAQLNHFGCRVDSIGTVGGWIQGGNDLQWRLQLTSQLNGVLENLHVGLSLELADRV